MKRESFLIFLTTALASFVLIEACSVQYNAVGCYKDDGKRPLPEQLLNERDTTSKVYNNRVIDWKNWNSYMVGLACRCAEKAAAKGYKVFGLQFYGECWSGPDAESYKSVGVAKYDQCVGRQYKPCTQFCKHCVGKQHRNFVYKIDTRGYY